jgi:dihydropteroate synthase
LTEGGILGRMIPLVMAVLNVTPDSFSDGGRHLSLADALDRAEEMITEGADIIDVGGESTRPGAAATPIDVELARVIPVIEALAGRVRLSVDTRHEPVARAAVAAGADMINDVSASLWTVAADTRTSRIAMHMVGTPVDMQSSPEYVDVVGEVRDFLVERATVARAEGVAEVWIDPGIGFGKTLEHNLSLLGALDELAATGFPVVVGTSRKAMLGQLTARSDARVGFGDGGAIASIDDRFAASVCTATWAMTQGAAMVRVHDVRAHVHAARVVAGQIIARSDQAA